MIDTYIWANMHNEPKIRDFDTKSGKKLPEGYYYLRSLSPEGKSLDDERWQKIVEMKNIIQAISDDTDDLTSYSFINAKQDHNKIEWARI